MGMHADAWNEQGSWGPLQLSVCLDRTVTCSYITALELNTGNCCLYYIIVSIALALVR
jgi:hypothetical protein